MEKLLHEILRDQDGDCLHLLQAVGGSCFAVKSCEDCRKNLANLIADEIERCYIPRPRFEDGEPVQFDDEVQLEDGTTCPATTLGMGCGGTLYVNPYSRDEGCIIELDPGDFVKRHTPKVYDADGVEIKVGDELYSKTTGTKRPPVESIRRAGKKNKYGFSVSRDIVCYGESFGNGKEWDRADDLTHERPVFDAEGVRICKGDTNCWTRDGRHVEILEVGTYQCGNGCLVRSDKGIQFVIEGNELTHREPDSLEKLRDDMRETMTNSPDARFMDSSWVYRLTALIERGA